MDFGEEFKCNQCLALFSLKKTPLKMPTCKHNICQQCFEEVKGSQLDLIQCSFCGVTVSQCLKKNLISNSTLLKKIRNFGSSFESSTISSSLKNNSNFQDSIMLLGEEDFHLKRKKSITLIRNEISIEMCPLHKKSLQIICLNDLKRICSHCAIFGQHKNHKFKTFQEFNEDYEQKLKDLQILKQKKYKMDKKTNFKNIIHERKQFLYAQVESKFDELIKRIKELKEKTKKDIEITFLEKQDEINKMLKETSKISNQFSLWESECENLLNRLSENIVLNEKISIMYNPLLKMQKGQKIFNNIEKKIQEIRGKAELQINNIGLDFTEINAALTNLKIKKAKKDVIPKLSFKVQNIPSTRTLFVEDPQTIIKTPIKNQTNRLTRCKSNLILNVPKANESDSIATQKKVKNKENDLLTGNPEFICSEFIKKDLKDVLDLSKCNLSDERAYDCLKQVRRNRKVKGIKLCKNHLTDSGFQKLISVLGSSSNLNLSQNQFTEQILNMIIKNRDKLSPLRIINVSSNNFNQRKAKVKVEALKKIGIIVTL